MPSFCLVQRPDGSRVTAPLDVGVTFRDCAVNEFLSLLEMRLPNRELKNLRFERAIPRTFENSTIPVTSDEWSDDADAKDRIERGANGSTALLSAENVSLDGEGSSVVRQGILEGIAYRFQRMDTHDSSNEDKIEVAATETPGRFFQIEVAGTLTFSALKKHESNTLNFNGENRLAAKPLLIHRLPMEIGIRISRRLVSADLFYLIHDSLKKDGTPTNGEDLSVGTAASKRLDASDDHGGQETITLDTIIPAADFPRGKQDSMIPLHVTYQRWSSAPQNCTKTLFSKTQVKDLKNEFWDQYCGQSYRRINSPGECAAEGAWTAGIFCLENTKGTIQRYLRVIEVGSPVLRRFLGRHHQQREELMKHFSKSMNLTPARPALSLLMGNLAGLRENHLVHDPFCGTGVLVEVAAEGPRLEQIQTGLQKRSGGVSNSDRNCTTVFGLGGELVDIEPWIRRRNLNSAGLESTFDGTKNGAKNAKSHHNFPVLLKDVSSRQNHSAHHHLPVRDRNLPVLDRIRHNVKHRSCMRSNVFDCLIFDPPFGLREDGESSNIKTAGEESKCHPSDHSPIALLERVNVMVHEVLRKAIGMQSDSKIVYLHPVFEKQKELGLWWNSTFTDTFTDKDPGTLSSSGGDADAILATHTTSHVAALGALLLGENLQRHFALEMCRITPCRSHTMARLIVVLRKK